MTTNHHMFMNIRRTLPVSLRVPSDLSSVVNAVGALVSRHGSLRTRVRDVDGRPRQETATGGRLPMLVTESDGDGTAAAGELTTRLGDVAFDHAREWPLRIGLVLVDGRVRQIVLIFSHSTVDAYAVDVVLRDLRVLLLRGSISTPPGPQSVEVAQAQQGSDHWRSDRAVEFWTRQYARLPQEPLEPTGPELDPRWQRGTLISQAIDQAARMIATRHRVSVSAVLSAGITALTLGRSRRQITALSNMAHNRFRADYTNAIANLGQVGFCVLEVADRPTFAELLPRLWQVSLEGYRHSSYDPAALRERFTELGYDYSTAFLPYYYFNDVRLPGGNSIDQSVTLPERELRATMRRSTFSRTRGLGRASWHLLTHVVDEPGAVGVTLTVDTRLLSADSIEPTLKDLENLLVEAAFRDVPWPWSPTSHIS